MEEEQAQRKVFEAATKGCITSVKQLMIDDPSIREALRLLLQTLSSDDDQSKSTERKRKKKSIGFGETIKDWLEKKKNSLMVVASLLATMCFQVGVNPPGGVWQEDNYLVNSIGEMVNSNGYSTTIPVAVDAQDKLVLYPHKAGCAVMARNDRAAYEIFTLCNTIGFVSSLSIIFLLMSGLPVRNRFFMWILMVITWIAISSTAMTYNVAVIALTPDEYNLTYKIQHSNFTSIIQYSMYSWLGLMLLILIAHGIRLLLRLVKTLFHALLKLFKLPFDCCNVPASSPPV